LGKDFSGTYEESSVTIVFILFWRVGEFFVRLVVLLLLLLEASKSCDWGLGAAFRFKRFEDEELDMAVLSLSGCHSIVASPFKKFTKESKIIRN